jgi:hypothetical protein
MRPILQEVETGRRPEWKDIADRSPTYKSYCAQWKSLAVRDGVLERNWESANGRSKVAQMVLPRSKVEDVLTELHGGPSGGHLGVSKTLNKIRQRYYGLQARNGIETWCRQCDVCAASRGPRTRNRGQIHQCNVGAPFERIAIDVAWTLPAERPRKQIFFDRYGLFHQVAGSLRPSQPGGLHSSRSSSYRLLLPFRDNAGCTQ